MKAFGLCKSSVAEPVDGSRDGGYIGVGVRNELGVEVERGTGNSLLNTSQAKVREQTT